MSLCTLEANPELTALFEQGARPAAVEVKTRRGVFRREVLYPKGDPKNPMTWDDVTRKFMKQAEPVIGHGPAAKIVDRTAVIDKEDNIRRYCDLLSAIAR